MKRLILSMEKGKISYVPNKTTFGRREPVIIKMINPMDQLIPTVNIINHNNRLIPCATPTDFLPRVDTRLKDKLDYIQKELIKIQEQRKEEEFLHFSFCSHIDDNVEQQVKLANELYRDKDISLGEAAIPHHLQERDLGSLNDRHPTNRRPYDTHKDAVDESKLKAKSMSRCYC